MVKSLRQPNANVNHTNLRKSNRKNQIKGLKRSNEVIIKEKERHKVILRIVKKFSTEYSKLDETLSCR